MGGERVLLTGASGSMGHEAFLELRRRAPRYRVKLLLRPSKVNKRLFAPYGDEPWLEIVWGDLTNSADVKRAVAGVDFVLHPAAMISPAADRDPERAYAINAGGMRNLLDAIRAEPEGAERIRLVAIGSVAQYGDRLPPLHWIRVGDPLRPSAFDYYALSKCEAERMMIESGLRYWASMRQTFIVIPNLLSLIDPILFHQPVNQHIELITRRDAGYGLVQCLEAPEDFWGRIYNMSGGPRCRVVYSEFMDHMFRLFGLGDFRRLFDRNWFALKNFHCGFYGDSDVLNAYLGHFRDGLEDYYELAERSAPAWMKWGARLGPKPIIRMLARRLAEPLQWIEKNDEAHIRAFLGSREAWQRIPGWEGAAERAAACEAPADDSKPVAVPTDPEGFARMRGGECLTSGEPSPGSPRRWRCGRGHEFEASARLLMQGGYWCPSCFPSMQDTSGWDYAGRAESDPLLARFLRDADREGRYQSP